VISRREFLARTAAVAATSRRGGRAQSGTWQAGVASADITPDAGLWMAGFAARTAAATGTAMPLYAKALLLGPRKDMDRIAEAIRKLQRPAGELRSL